MQIQDPVHGTMEFTGLSALVGDLLHLPEIDRLRDLRQLDLVAAVYPGAEHSRRQHALGSAYLAQQFARQLREASRDTIPEALLPDDSAIRDLVVAALVQNVGHGPFSTVWESTLFSSDEDSNPEERFDRAAWIEGLGISGFGLALDALEWHELVAIGHILGDGRLGGLLTSRDPDLPMRVARLITRQGWPRYLAPLLKGDIDVDRIDFLQRDALFAGVTYGLIDEPRIRGSASLTMATAVIPTDQGAPVTLATSHDPPHDVGEERSIKLVFDGLHGANAIEQLLIGHRAMYRSVYHHRSVMGAQLLLAAILKRAQLVARELSDPPLLSDDVMQRLLVGEVVPAREMLRLTDASVWNLIHELSSDRVRYVNPDAADLARRFLDRDWFRLAVTGDSAAALLGSPDWREALRECVLAHIDPPTHGGPLNGAHHFVVKQVPKLRAYVSNEQTAYILTAAGPVTFFDSNLFPDPDAEVTETRIYVPAEALDAVKELATTSSR